MPLNFFSNFLQKAKSDLKRFENLSPGEAVSTQQIEEVRLALQNAKSNYLTLKKQYENTFVKEWNKNTAEAVAEVLKYMAQATASAIKETKEERK